MPNTPKPPTDSSTDLISGAEFSDTLTTFSCVMFKYSQYQEAAAD